MTVPTLGLFLIPADDNQVFAQTYNDKPLVIAVFTGTQEEQLGPSVIYAPTAGALSGTF